MRFGIWLVWLVNSDECKLKSVWRQRLANTLAPGSAHQPTNQPNSINQNRRAFDSPKSMSKSIDAVALQNNLHLSG